MVFSSIGVEVSADLKHGAKARESSPFMLPDIDALDSLEGNAGIYLRSNWQVHGYLLQQADEIEKYAFFEVSCLSIHSFYFVKPKNYACSRHGSSFPLNTLESVLKQLQKLAPELHRVSCKLLSSLWPCWRWEYLSYTDSSAVSCIQRLDFRLIAF